MATTRRSKERLLKKLYYDIHLPSAFASLNSLTKAVKAYDPSITNTFVRAWMSKQDTFVLHKRKRKRFPRRKIITRGIDYLHQMDLMDMTKLARYNGGHRFLLVNIDCFSRYAWVEPLKRKTGEQVAQALEKIYSRNTTRIPTFCHSDRGLEFMNYHVRVLFKKYNIKWYWVASKMKAAIAERFIRSFRLILAKALHGKGNRRYLDMLPELVNLYNSRVHRSIKMSPKSVSKENETILWQYQYADQFPSKTNFRFEIGDNVKIAVDKKIFEKEWTPAWSTKTYSIIYRKASRPPTYKVTDTESGTQLPGSYYEEELQLHKVVAGNDNE